METKHDLEIVRYQLRRQVAELRAAVAELSADRLPACPLCRVYRAVKRALSALRRRNRLHADGDGPDLGCVCRLLDAPGKGRAGEGVTE